MTILLGGTNISFVFVVAVVVIIVVQQTSCVQVILNIFFLLSKWNFDLPGTLGWTQVVVFFPSKLFDAVEMEGWSRRGHLSSEGFFFVNNRSRALDLYLMELCAASVSRTAHGFRNHNYRPSRLQPVVSFVNVYVSVLASFHTPHLSI